jgi:hypothetical protein
MTVNVQITRDLHVDHLCGGQTCKSRPPGHSILFLNAQLTFAGSAADRSDPAIG